MTVFLISFFVFVFLVAAMAIGAIVSNRSIKGSCGGLSSIDGLESACAICEGRKQCKRGKKSRLRA